jgi:hypothetical protein
MLGRMLNIAGINDFLYFFGEVSQPKRDKAIHEFQDDPKKKIMVRGVALKSPIAWSTAD